MLLIVTLHETAAAVKMPHNLPQDDRSEPEKSGDSLPAASSPDSTANQEDAGEPTGKFVRKADELTLVGRQFHDEGTKPYHAGEKDLEWRGLLRVEDLKLDPPQREKSLGRMAHYEVQEFVGNGAMGIVLRAFDEQLHRQVAIKVMSPDLISRPTARERFFREARAAASIGHPNVVTIHAVSEHHGVPYLVMEYVDGNTLQKRIQQGVPLPLHDILRISVQIAEGLSAAHRHGIVHRDIKPGNIMLERGIERVKIADFGLARVAMDSSDLTSLGDMIGTPAFMSPEQVDGLPLDARSDLFSFGCVIYAMVAGNSPFRSTNALATARKVSSEKHPSLTSISKVVPGYLSDIVDKLLEKKPENRFESAERVYQSLTIRLAELNRGLDEAATFRALQTTDSAHATTSAPVAPPATMPLLRRGLGWAGTLLLVFALVGVLEAFIRWNTADKPPVGYPPKSAASDSPSNGTAAKNASAESGMLVRVAADGSADATTVMAALRKVQPGGTIRVIDRSRYVEPVVIDQVRGFTGITLEATDGAILSAPTGSVLTIRGVPRVTVRGFRVETSGLQKGIEVAGRCSGMLLESCVIASLTPEEGALAAVYFHDMARGERDLPMCLRDCRIHCGGVGLVIGSDVTGDLVQHLVVERNRIHGPARGHGFLVVMQNQVADIAFHRNIVANGARGLNLHFADADSLRRVSISWNTFHDLAEAFALPVIPASFATEFQFESNLFLSVPAAVGPLVPEAVSWFKNNQWEKTAEANEPQIRLIAKLVETVSLKSRNRDSAEYLVPDDDLRSQLPGRFSPDESDTSTK